MNARPREEAAPRNCSTPTAATRCPGGRYVSSPNAGIAGTIRRVEVAVAALGVAEDVVPRQFELETVDDGALEIGIELTQLPVIVDLAQPVVHVGRITLEGQAPGQLRRGGVLAQLRGHLVLDEVADGTASHRSTGSVTLESWQLAAEREAAAGQHLLHRQPQRNFGAQQRALARCCRAR